MPSSSRTTYRRGSRRRSPLPAVLGACALVVAIGAAIALTWPAWHHPQAPSPATAPVRPTSTRPTAAAAAPNASATDSSSPNGSAQATVVPAPDAAAKGAASASEKAMAAAAVPFPGAPAISPMTRSINHLNPRHKYIALTLDDGYNFQPEMLKLLEQYDAHCTTFLIGSWAASHKADVKLMRDAGFEIANHSYTHPALTKLSSAQIASQLTKTQRVITSVTGNQAPYLRPPFGATDAHVKASAASLGYRIVMWDRTFGDSGRGPTVDKLYYNVMKSGGGIQPGDIVLCHWGSKMSYQTLKRVLPDLKAQGYEFVTISELIADSK